MMIFLSNLVLLAVIIYLSAEIVIPSFSNKEYWWIYKKLREKKSDNIGTAGAASEPEADHESDSDTGTSDTRASPQK